MRDRRSSRLRSPQRRRLARALRRLFGVRGSRPPSHDLEARVDYLERELSEVRGRVNGLFFAVLGAVLIDVLGRVALG